MVMSLDCGEGVAHCPCGSGSAGAIFRYLMMDRRGRKPARASAVWMKRQALPLVPGVQGSVRICLRPNALQALAKSLTLQHEPFSVITRVTLMPRLS